jgi:serine O-acetyltransferase
MLSISQTLDRDWGRLCELANLTPQKRRFRHGFSPRFAPVTLIRLAQYLHQNAWPRLAKIPSLVNFVAFGIEVPPRLPIGPGLVIMHTQGTVLGANSIGENFTVYHQVTLGAKDMDFSYTPTKRPTIGSNVTVSVGAKILGGITLEDGCVIGANAVVLKDVPAGLIAVGIPARNINKKSELSEV